VRLPSAPEPARLTATGEVPRAKPAPKPSIMTRMAPILRNAWRDLAYHGLTLPVSIALFTVVVTGLSIALSFALLIIGLPVALATFFVFRMAAGLERRRAALWIGPVGEAYRPRRHGLLRQMIDVLTDPQSWKDLAWLTFVGTFGFAASVAALSAWLTVLWLVTVPTWYWSVPDPGAQVGWLEVNTFGEAFVAFDIGIILIPIAYLLSRWLAEGQLRLSRVLLAPGREAALTARVSELTATRAGAVDAAAAELQRIERDLHDGAQARLVALALDLGMAEERFDRDPDGARELIGGAREEAKRALAELRDLARGIRPSLLAERGLGPALTALAARSPVSAAVELDVPPDVPPQVELAVWFVVSEALANAGKHSGAARVLVRVHRDAGGPLQAEVIDDGRGGADPDGEGLTGLRGRVEALDGTLTVTSPPGGPTSIRAEFPCNTTTPEGAR
jgi:signal transduction histidine kinase